MKDKYLPVLYNVGYLGDTSWSNNKKEYSTWKNMISRCYNVNDKNYSNYGGIGVRVDKRWHCFKNFIDDIKEIQGWDAEAFKNNEICLDKDKKQNTCTNKIYSKETCAWITYKENINLQKRYKEFKAIAPNNKVYYSKNQSDFALEHNLNRKRINECLNNKKDTYKGWRFVFVD